MKKFIILIIVVVLIVLVYRGWGGGAGSLVPPPIVATLAAQNQSGETGQAVLTEDDGQVKVTMTIIAAPPGVPQPAHVHRGSCATLGEPVYTLSPVTDGASDTTLTASFQTIRSSLPLAINVHKSADDPGTYVACGDITAPGK